MIYEKSLAEYKRLEKQIDELDKQLKGYPAGKLFITRNGKRYKWYLTDGHTQVYLPKKEVLQSSWLQKSIYLVNWMK